MAKASRSKPPKLSFEAEHALSQASDPFFTIELAIERLEEPDLVSVAGEARRRAVNGQHPELNLAIASFAEAQAAIINARLSSGGIWYACLDVIQWEANRHTGQGIASYTERCEGRESAVDAARQLLATHLLEFTAETTLDARVVTELEWLADAPHAQVGTGPERL